VRVFSFVTYSTRVRRLYFLYTEMEITPRVFQLTRFPGIMLINGRFKALSFLSNDMPVMN
jgi:hypothetical protein